MMEIPCSFLGILGIVLISLAVLIYLKQSELLVKKRAGIVKTLIELSELYYLQELNKIVAYQNIISISGE
ncbi:MAG: hypothetical protein ACFFC3_09080 [Candidatus Odinarchaeota archaeon]